MSFFLLSLRSFPVLEIPPFCELCDGEMVIEFAFDTTLTGIGRIPEGSNRIQNYVDKLRNRRNNRIKIKSIDFEQMQRYHREAVWLSKNTRKIICRSILYYNLN